MAAAIRERHTGAQVELKPGGRGDFIVTVDGRKVWDKRAQGDEFPDDEALLDELRVAG